MVCEHRTDDLTWEWVLCLERVVRQNPRAPKKACPSFEYVFQAAWCVPRPLRAAGRILDCMAARPGGQARLTHSIGILPFLLLYLELTAHNPRPTNCSSAVHQYLHAAPGPSGRAGNQIGQN